VLVGENHSPLAQVRNKFFSSFFQFVQWAPLLSGLTQATHSCLLFCFLHRYSYMDMFSGIRAWPSWKKISTASFFKLIFSQISPLNYFVIQPHLCVCHLCSCTTVVGMSDQQQQPPKWWWPQSLGVLYRKSIFKNTFLNGGGERKTVHKFIQQKILHEHPVETNKEATL